MAYVDIPNTVLETDDPIRSVDAVQMNDNIKDHESRLNVLPNLGGVFSHFTSNQGYGSGIIVTGAQIERYFEDQFYIESGVGGQVNNQAALAADDHRLLMNGPCQVIGRPAFHFTNRVKPITFKARCKFHAFPTDVFIGLAGAALVGNDFPVVGVTTRPVRAIILERFNATDVVFTSRVGANVTQGTSFAKPANGVWFEVKIIFTNTPGNQADCYIDGVLKQTLSTAASLPTADNIYPCALLPEAGADNLSLDRVECFAGGALADLT